MSTFKMIQTNPVSTYKDHMVNKTAFHSNQRWSF